MRFIAVLNRDGGTFRTMDMEAFSAEAVRVFSMHGHQFDGRVVAGGDLERELRRAAADAECEVLLAGGGDGTISAAAEVCYELKKPLAVLPAGTMNLFARSLQVPLDLNQALEAIASGELRDVDIATANGRPFVHQFSVGLHTRLVGLREGLPYRSRAGKIVASVRAVAGALARPLAFDAEIRTPRGVERRRATAISVSNNAFGEGHIPYAEDIDRGVLGVYVIKPMPPGALARLVVGVMLGTWKQDPRVSEKEVRQVTLVFPKRKASARAVIDGELIPLPARVDIASHPGALRVMAPLTAAAERPAPVAA